MRIAIASTLVAAGLTGCCAGPEYAVLPECPPQGAAPGQPVVVEPTPVVHANPVFLPTIDHDAAWEETVDVLDDYFRIDHEEPVRVVGSEPIEGVVTTVPEVSPTILEPWRRDTGDSQERIENTLQTMRRHAVVRVIPQQGGGHWVDVQVYKELENPPQPENARAGTATLRYDSSFTRIEDPISEQPISDRWIPRGRDTSLEQRIINDLLCRSGQAGSSAVGPALR